MPRLDSASGSTFGPTHLLARQDLRSIVGVVAQLHVLEVLALLPAKRQEAVAEEAGLLNRAARFVFPMHDQELRPRIGGEIVGGAAAISSRSMPPQSRNAASRNSTP